MSNEIAVQQPQQLVKASTSLSQFLGVEPGMMIETIKRQCFRNMNADQVSDAQLAAFISVANSLKINPLLPGFLHAFPERNGGITPILGPDAMFKMLAEHPEIVSWETEVFPLDVAMPPTHAVTKIWRKGIERPVSYTALLSEWRVSNNPNWQTRPRHMLGIRSLKQCARQLVHGIPFDEDERRIADMVNVTDSAEQPAQEPKTKRTPPPQRSQKGVAAVVENAPEQTKPAEQAAVEIQATPTPETTAAAEPVAEVSAETPVEPAPETAPEPKAPVTQLAHQESGTFVSKIVSFTHTAKGNTNAKLEGDFTGEVFQMDSKKNPAYVEGAICRFKLEGQYSAKNNLTYNMVRGIEAQMPEEF